MFNEGDFVYAVLTKDRFPVGAYNKLKARKIGPVKIVKQINDNAYKLELPEDAYTSDVFNVKHLIPYHEDEQSNEEELLNSRTNFFQPGEDDAVQTFHNSLLISSLRLIGSSEVEERANELIGSSEEGKRVNYNRWLLKSSSDLTSAEKKSNELVKSSSDLTNAEKKSSELVKSSSDLTSAEKKKEMVKSSSDLTGQEKSLTRYIVMSFHSNPHIFKSLGVELEILESLSRSALLEAAKS